MLTQKKWLGSVSTCNLCHSPLRTFKYFVDGMTRIGCWALMCPPCFHTFGVGLGTGKGQKYNTETREKIAG